MGAMVNIKVNVTPLARGIYSSLMIIDELWPPVHKYCHSVDRTNSSRKRAGGRRNKKLKNVRTFKSDWRDPR